MDFAAAFALNLSEADGLTAALDDAPVSSTGETYAVLDEFDVGIVTRSLVSSSVSETLTKVP